MLSQVIVMTNLSAKILKNEYQIEDDKIKFILMGHILLNL
jgi:hypothetical protein